MAVRSSSEFIQFIVSGGNPDEIVQNQRQEVQEALRLQELMAEFELNRRQDRLEDQVENIVNRLAALNPLDARKEQLAALQEKTKKLRAVQEKLLKEVKAKEEQLHMGNRVIDGLNQEVNLARSRLNADPYSYEKQSLLRLGDAASYHLSRRGRIT
jgi:hypothetical protein